MGGRDERGDYLQSVGANTGNARLPALVSTFHYSNLETTMKIQNIKKAIVRMFKNIRWLMLVDHGASVDTIGEVIERLDARLIENEMHIDHLMNETHIDYLMNEAINDYDFDELIDDRIGAYDLSEVINDEIAANDFDFSEAIADAVGEYDYSDDIVAAIDHVDFEHHAREALDDHDLSEAISDAIDDHDFSHEIESALEDFDQSVWKHRALAKVKRSVLKSVMETMNSAKLRIELSDLSADDDELSEEQSSKATRAAAKMEKDFMDSLLDDEVSDPLMDVLALVTGEKKEIDITK